jgi:hypothetical protein
VEGAQFSAFSPFQKTLTNHPNWLGFLNPRLNLRLNFRSLVQFFISAFRGIAQLAALIISSRNLFTAKDLCSPNVLSSCTASFYPAAGVILSMGHRQKVLMAPGRRERERRFCGKNNAVGRR